MKRLFPNYVEVEKRVLPPHGIFPIMHTIVIRRDVYNANPWVAQSLYKAFIAAKAKAYALCNQTAALKAMLPWLDGARRGGAARDGRGLVALRPRANRATLDTFLRYHHEQGLSKRRLAPDELFARETLMSFKV